MQSKADSTQPTAVTETKNLHITGMHCASCATLIQRKLVKEPGVTDATVSFANHQAVVEYQPKQVNDQKLIDAVAAAGYKASVMTDQAEDVSEQEREIELRYLKNRLWIAGILTGILLLTMIPGMSMWLHNPWLLWALATPVQFWVGWRFYQGAWSALRAGGATMDTLIALGTSVAYGYSVVAVLFSEQLLAMGVEPHLYFEAAAAIIAFVTLGKYLELRSRGKTAEALEALAHLQPREAFRIGADGSIERVELQDVVVGDRLLVKAGQQVPVDGKIVTGSAVLDESMVTGESVPVTKEVGDGVVGATVNAAGSFEMVTEKVGGEMFLSQIIELVRRAQASRPQVQQLVDTIAGYFVPVALGLSLVAFGVWWLFGPDPGWLYGMVSMTAVLIIACPCALGLATPTALIAGVGRGAQVGILIKDAQALELAQEVTTIIFDKTGTLTEGKPSVTDTFFSSTLSQQQVQKLQQQILTLETQSQHPLAAAVVRHFEALGVSSEATALGEVEEAAGKGVRATFGPKEVIIGTKAFLQEQKISLDKKALARTEQWQKAGQTVIQIGAAGKHLGSIALADTLRAGAAETVAQLQQQGLEILLLSGDTQKTVEAIAAQVGIGNIQAEVLPDQKEAVVAELTNSGKKVAFVGDGINDAPALARAHLGIAMGGGTDVARGAAEVVLLHSDIRLVPQALVLAKSTLRIIKQNLFWAFAYNVTLIPVAMGVLYPFFGIQLQPLFAGAAMAFSSVSVVLNALRLQRIRLVPGETAKNSSGSDITTGT
ncbi:MAG: heavy metal translocating P-type ATPase [Patescibacteria group bacterium]